MAFTQLELKRIDHTIGPTDHGPARSESGPHRGWSKRRSRATADAKLKLMWFEGSALLRRTTRRSRSASSARKIATGEGTEAMHPPGKAEPGEPLALGAACVEGPRETPARAPQPASKMTAASATTSAVAAARRPVPPVPSSLSSAACEMETSR